MGASKKKVAKDKFKFVNYTSPNDARKRDNRTQVRSHVTRWQHTNSRANTAQYKLISPGHGIGARTDDAEELASYASISSKSVDLAEPPGFPELTEHREASHAKGNYFRRDTNECDTEATTFASEACRLVNGGMMHAFSQGAMSFRTIALQDSQNIIGVGLRDMQLELSSVMGLYSKICEIQAVDFARQYDIKGDEASWGRFYAYVYTDPILLSTAVLLGVRNQLDVLGRRIEGRTFASIVQIEQFLMRSISDTLGDPTRGISDQMLIAVALCAAYEIKHGTGACYHIHMRGLLQMIHLRGGLLAIGLHDPYVVRLLIWLDTNTAKIAGCKPYLQGMVNGLASHPHANTTIFRARGDVP